MNANFKEISKLRNELEHANAMVAYYKSLLAVPESYPEKLGLTPDETRVLSAIRSAHGVCTFDRANAEIGHDDDNRILLRVHVCRIRKKLHPYNINIRTVREFGYLIDESSRIRLSEVINGKT